MQKSAYNQFSSNVRVTGVDGLQHSTNITNTQTTATDEGNEHNYQHARTQPIMIPSISNPSLDCVMGTRSVRLN